MVLEYVASFVTKKEALPAPKPAISVTALTSLLN
jgi:hypothetical protein